MKVERDRWSAAQYRSLIEQIPAIVYIDAVDEEMSTTYISPQIERLLGVMPQEYLDDPDLWTELLHPDDRERALADYIEGRAGGRPFSFEYRLIARDGRVVYFRDDAMVVLNEAGAPSFVQGVMTDVTEARTADEALRRSEQRHRDLVETAQDVIYTIGPDASLTSLNAAFERVTGWPREEWLGKPFGPLVHPDDLPRAFALFQEVADGRAPQAFELRIAKKNGTYGIGEFTVSPQVEDGVVVGGLGIAREITERKRVEEELQVAKEMAEQANRAKSEFLANMSHEIRTPLNAVIGLSGLLLETDLTREQRDYVETVRSSGDALLSVINDVLDFSKIEAGRLEVEHAQFDPRTCVEEALDVVASAAAAKGLELAYLVDQEVPPALVGDVTRVRQILVNLLSNAVKFTESGEVVATVSSRPRDERRHDVHFVVLDTGIGIPSEAMDRLFDSFTQVDASITRRYGGSGLGLAISRKLAEIMGGGLWAESVVGAGSTFHFTILAEIGQDEPIRRTADGPNLTGRRALIVDDNATNRLILSKQVRGWGMTPVESSTPRDAMDLIRASAFDVAILDMCMPGLDGESLAAEIQADPHGEAVPLIMLTSLGRRQDESPDGQMFAAYLTKPVKPSRLHGVLCDVLAARMPGRGAAAPGGPQEAERPLAERHPLRILVAEDNAVNQKVALRILERLGYRADVAADGIEVLEAIERQPYDVILMDVQMPEMDGLEATRRIRRTWPEGRRPRIVAMTANAMQGDRERCFEAGMDDYVSKPVRLAELEDALSRCAPVIGRAESQPAVDESVLRAFADHLGDTDGTVVREIVAVFLSDAPAIIGELREACDTGDAATIDRAAHTLKSSSGTVGAKVLSALCQELETRARAGDLVDATSEVERIDREFGRVREALGAAG